jgi:predicted permease
MRATPGPLIEARGPARPGRANTIATRLAAVTTIVLIIAWANVVNLLFTRALDRRREIALRVALGMSRLRLVRILTIESLGFALVAGAAALLLAREGGSLLRDLLFPGIDWTHAVVGWRVAGFAGLVAFISGLVAGVVPGWQATRPAFADALRTASAGGRVRSRLASSLVVVQAGLSMTLLVGAALFVRSLQKVQSLDIGLDTDRLLFASAEFGEGDSPPAPIVLAAYQDIAARLRTRPDVEVVARASWEPMMGFGANRFFTDTDSAESFQSRWPSYSAVTPEFFEATGLRMVRGPGFAAGAAEYARSVVVNEAMAAQVWPGREALGQCLRIRERTSPCHVVTGVVENANQSYLIEPAPAPQYYLPLGSPAFSSAGVLVVRADPRRHAGIAADLRRELAQALPAALPVTRRMLDNLEPEYRPWRVGASLFTAVGGLALLVALMGIYSSVSFGVGRRTHEFAVRSALGARLGTIVRQVVSEELRPVALGVVLGAAAALAASPLIASMLFGVSATNPSILGAVAVALLAAGAGAALIPARRASLVDPMVVLKAD